MRLLFCLPLVLAPLHAAAEPDATAIHAVVQTEFNYLASTRTATSSGWKRLTRWPASANATPS